MGWLPKNDLIMALKEEHIMADKTLTCKDCGKEFVFTESEQDFYKEKGFENDPVRCAECRRARKANNNRNNFRER